ncbi:MAG: glycosyltransferase family 4 protein [bacterium]|nr:glycosyltransferase family 4 protein [bacterium]
MTIGFVLDDRLDKPDGVQQYINTLGNWLSDRGHSVYYLVGESPSMKNRNDVIHLGKTLEMRFNKNRMGVPLPISRQSAKKVFHKIDFDILHVQMPYSPQVASRIINAAPAKTAIVGTFHILPYSAPEKIGTRLLAGTLRRSRNKFDKIFSVSEAAQGFAKKYFKVESTVLPNTINLKLFESAGKIEDSGRQKIVFLGRLVKRKGALELMRAYETLLDIEPQFASSTELIIGGKGELMQQLELMKSDVNSKYKRSKITLAGFVNEKDKPKFLRQATLAVFPATGGESFGITLLEGMAAGAEVVLAGDNPGYRSVMGKISGSMFNPSDSGSFAKTMKHLLTDDSARAELHEAQAKYIKKFDVNIVGKNLEAEYIKLASAKQKQHNKP